MIMEMAFTLNCYSTLEVSLYTQTNQQIPSSALLLRWYQAWQQKLLSLLLASHSWKISAWKFSAWNSEKNYDQLEKST